MDKNCLDAEALKQILSAHGMEGKHLLVGFSGGRDSSVLLTLLAALREDLSLRLSACHVHHGIRGESADRDAAFCEARCATLNIRFFLEKIDLPALAKAQGKGLEECGRDARYEILRTLADRLSADYIVTAHHADDQLETVLLHLTRGSGLRGLCGMEAERNGIFRPLLEFSEEEIEDCRRRQAIPYTEDESNADLRYSRNLLRHEVLPVLKRLNPLVTDAVGRTVTLLRRDADYLNMLAEEAAALPNEKLRLQPRPILSRVLDGRYRSYTGLPGLPFAALERLCDLFTAGEGMLSLPGGVGAVCEKGRLLFFPDPRVAAEPDEVPLTEGRTVCFHGYRVLSEKNCGETQKNTENEPNVHTVIMKEGYAHECLSLRCLRDGDRILLGGRWRKVNELLRAAGISGIERRYFPLVCDREKVLVLPGIAVADGCLVPASECANQNENEIRLTFEKWEETNEIS